MEVHCPFILKHLSLLEAQKIMINCSRCWVYRLMPAGALTIKRIPLVLSRIHTYVHHTLRVVTLLKICCQIQGKTCNLV